MQSLWSEAPGCKGCAGHLGWPHTSWDLDREWQTQPKNCCMLSSAPSGCPCRLLRIDMTVLMVITAFSRQLLFQPMWRCMTVSHLLTRSGGQSDGPSPAPPAVSEAAPCTAPAPLLLLPPTEPRPLASPALLCPLAAMLLPGAAPAAPAAAATAPPDAGQVGFSQLTSSCCSKVSLMTCCKWSISSTSSH